MSPTDLRICQFPKGNQMTMAQRRRVQTILRMKRHEGKNGKSVMTRISLRRSTCTLALLLSPLPLWASRVRLPRQCRMILLILNWPCLRSLFRWTNQCKLPHRTVISLDRCFILLIRRSSLVVCTDHISQIFEIFPLDITLFFNLHCLLIQKYDCVRPHTPHLGSHLASLWQRRSISIPWPSSITDKSLPDLSQLSRYLNISMSLFRKGGGSP